MVFELTVLIIAALGFDFAFVGVTRLLFFPGDKLIYRLGEKILHRSHSDRLYYYPSIGQPEKKITLYSLLKAVMPKNMAATSNNLLLGTTLLTYRTVVPRNKITSVSFYCKGLFFYCIEIDVSRNEYTCRYVIEIFRFVPRSKKRALEFYKSLELQSDKNGRKRTEGLRKKEEREERGRRD